VKTTELRVKVNGRWFRVEVADLEASPVLAVVDGAPLEVDLGEPTEAPLPVAVEASAPPPAVPVAPTPAIEAPVPPATPSPSHPAGAVKSFTSPMPGVVISLAVGVGDQVVTGDEVCILEAMKMQQTLRADWSGVVAAVHVVPGQQVPGGHPILDLA